MNENMQPNNEPMNNMPVNNMQSMPNSMPENKSSIGSIIGTIIVIAIIILGGLYFWGKRIDEARQKQEMSSSENADAMTSGDNMEVNTITNVNNSDDLNSIEADLNNTNLNNLGAELDVQQQ